MASRVYVDPTHVSHQAPSDPIPPSHRRALRRLVAVLVAAASGVLVAVAFPPFDQVWAMPLGLAGLLVLTGRTRGRGGFGLGLAFGVGFMLVLMNWLTIIGWDAWSVLSLLEGLFYAVMAMTWSWVGRRTGWPLAVAALWVGGEFLRGTFPFGGLPWGRLAFGLVDTPFVRYGRLGGTALVSFLAVLVVALVVDVIERRRWSRLAVGSAVVAVLIMALSPLLPVGAAGAVGSVQVAAIQGNVPGKGLNPFAHRRAVVDNHAAATEQLAAQVAAGSKPKPQLVIWPENSTDIDPFANRSVYAEINRAVQTIGVPTLVGAVVSGPDPDHVENMGIVWSPTTGPGAHYIKQHLVPFGEYIPFRSVLTKFISRLKEIPRDFAPGHRPGDLQLGPVRIGDVICFEVAYDGLVRDVIKGGARLLVVQTNNATYVGTGQLQQQFAMSQYRAIETGRSVVIASTDGISGIINPDGTIVVQTKQKTRAIIDERVTTADGVTLGVRIGGWLDIALALAGLLAAVGAYLGNRRTLGRMAA
ncbi:MAG: apolipoprotein N-acyltransferase [Nocardioidaceae bacterium]